MFPRNGTYDTYVKAYTISFALPPVCFFFLPSKFNGLLPRAAWAQRYDDTAAVRSVSAMSIVGKAAPAPTRRQSTEFWAATIHAAFIDFVFVFGVYTVNSSIVPAQFPWRPTVLYRFLFFFYVVRTCFELANLRRYVLLQL